MTYLFWFALFTLVYAFFGYPVGIRLAARWFGKQPARDDTMTPSVSILLSVYNEEQVIRQKIENFLALDYPADCIELLVISDGCTDQTEEIVNAFRSEQIRLLIQEARGGKTLALNRGAEEANGDILVFTDANSMFRPDSIRKLVSSFADPSVGLVSGRSVYVDERGGETVGGIYRRYEEWIKESESKIFSIVGADGAIYAIRKDIYEPLKSIFINDLLHPVQVVQKKLRAISAIDAVVVERCDDNDADELQRQIRIMAQSWLVCLNSMESLFLSHCYGYIWQLISHKILRWLTIPLLFILGMSSAFLIASGVVYKTALFSLVLLIGLAWYGSIKTGGVAGVAWSFLVLHWAAIVGVFELLRGRMFITWDPRKS